MQDNNIEIIKKYIPKDLILVDITNKDFNYICKKVDMIRGNMRVVLYCTNKQILELYDYPYHQVILFYNDSFLTLPQVLINNENSLKLNINKFIQMDEECVICYEKNMIDRSIIIQSYKCSNCGCNICTKCMEELLELVDMTLNYKCPMCREYRKLGNIIN